MDLILLDASKKETASKRTSFSLTASLSPDLAALVTFSILLFKLSKSLVVVQYQ